VDHDWVDDVIPNFDKRVATGVEKEAVKEYAEEWVNDAMHYFAFDYDFFRPPKAECFETEYTYGRNDPSVTSKHDFVYECTATFQELIVPNQNDYGPPEYVNDLRNRLVINTSNILGLLTQNLDADNVFKYATQNIVSQVNYIPRSGSDSRREFLNAYVLPYHITWDMDTDDRQATNDDYAAVANATEQWLNENWDHVYGSPESVELFARRTTTAKVLTGAFYNPRQESLVYSQSVTCAVELLIAANSITDVPTVKEYTTLMRYFYKIPLFRQMLLPVLAEDSVFRTADQTTYAITPSYQVTTLQERIDREDDLPGPGEDVNLDSIAVVSVSMGGL